MDMGRGLSNECYDRHVAFACRNVMVGMGPWPAEMLWTFKTGVCRSCAYFTTEHVAKACSATVSQWNMSIRVLSDLSLLGVELSPLMRDECSQVLSGWLW